MRVWLVEPLSREEWGGGGRTEKSSRKRDERNEIGEAYGKAIVGQVQKNKEKKAGCAVLKNWINDSQSGY